MTEFGKRLIESAQQALEYAKGTAEPGSVRVSVYEDGELQEQPDAKKPAAQDKKHQESLALEKMPVQEESGS